MNGSEPKRLRTAQNKATTRNPSLKRSSLSSFLTGYHVINPVNKIIENEIKNIGQTLSWKSSETKTGDNMVILNNINKKPSTR